MKKLVFALLAVASATAAMAQYSTSPGVSTPAVNLGSSTQPISPFPNNFGGGFGGGGQMSPAGSIQISQGAVTCSPGIETNVPSIETGVGGVSHYGNQGFNGYIATNQIGINDYKQNMNTAQAYVKLTIPLGNKKAYKTVDCSKVVQQLEESREMELKRLKQDDEIASLKRQLEIRHLKEQLNAPYVKPTEVTVQPAQPAQAPTGPVVDVSKLDLISIQGQAVYISVDGLTTYNKNGTVFKQRASASDSF